MTATKLTSLPPPPDTEQPNILYYGEILKRGKLLLACVTLGLTALGVGAASVIQPVYESTVTIVSTTRDSTTSPISSVLGSLSGLLSINPQGISKDREKEEALAILRSRSFLSKFIQRRNLIKILFDKDDFVYTKSKKIPTSQDAYEKFSNDVLSVEETIAKGTIKLKIHWKDPIVGANWANALVTDINSHLRSETIKEKRKRIDYLEKVLTKTEVIQIQKAIYALIQKQIHESMLAATRQNYVFKIIDPAVPADPDGFVRPRRFLIIFFFTILGLLAGSFTVILRDHLRRVAA